MDNFLESLCKGKKFENEYRNILIKNQVDDTLEIRRFCQYFPNFARLLGIEFEHKPSESIFPSLRNLFCDVIVPIPPITKPTGLIFYMKSKYNIEHKNENIFHE